MCIRLQFCSMVNVLWNPYLWTNRLFDYSVIIPAILTLSHSASIEMLPLWPHNDWKWIKIIMEFTRRIICNCKIVHKMNASLAERFINYFFKKVHKTEPHSMMKHFLMFQFSTQSNQLMNWIWTRTMAIYHGDCLVTHCFMSPLENCDLIHAPVNDHWFCKIILVTHQIQS